MKKQMAKVLAGGVVLGSLLTMGVGYASDYFESIDVYTKPVTITYNGETLVASDKPNQFNNGTEYVPDAFQFKGTTYVPISFLAQELNKNVSWDGGTRTIALKDNHPHGIVAGSLEPTLTKTEDGKFVFMVKNQTENEVTLEFTSSQRYDVAVKNEAGETVYLFSSLATFAQVMGEEKLVQGEELLYVIDPAELGLPEFENGKYTIEAWLTPNSEEKQPVASAEYVVE